MSIFAKRRPSPYEPERQRLLKLMAAEDPDVDSYGHIIVALDRLDQIDKRSSDTVKALIPSVGTGLGIIGIYALQQFCGIIVPKALETIASRNNQSN